MDKTDNLQMITKSQVKLRFKGTTFVRFANELGVELYIDSELQTYPTAAVWKRVSAFFLDKILIVLTALLAGAMAIPVVWILAFLGAPKIVAQTTQWGMIVTVVLFVMLWGNWLRVGYCGQTFGMSLLNISVASDHRKFKTKFMNRWFFWANIAVKDMPNPWDGDEVEERADAQLWRGLLPLVLFPLIALMSGAVLYILASLPLVIWNSANGEFQFQGLNSTLSLIVLSPIILSLFIAQLGFLFALGKEKRTLCDHFLGIKFVDVKNSPFALKAKKVSEIKLWIMGEMKESQKVEI